MTISANTIWEVRADGNDENGGGFVEGGSGTDYSQQAAPQLAVIDAVTNGTTTVTSATGGFTSAMVDNIIYLDGSWYQITAFSDSNTITIDTAVSAASGLTLNVGGALASLGGLGRASNGGSGGLQLGHEAHVRGGTYIQTSASANVPGGMFDFNDFASSRKLLGYGTTRGDNGRPVIQFGSLTSAYAIDLASSRNTFLGNFDFQCGFNSGVSPFGGSMQASDSHMFNVICREADSHGFDIANGHLQRCAAIDCGGRGFSTTAHLRECLAMGNTDIGIVTSNDIVDCYSLANGGDGFNSSFTTNFNNCVSALNGGDGFKAGSSRDHLMSNMLAVRNGGYAFNLLNNSTDRQFIGFNLVHYNNTSGAFNTFHANFYGEFINTIALTADPFTDADNDDFTLNNVAGGGAVLREELVDFASVLSRYPFLTLLDGVPAALTLAVVKRRAIR